MKKIIITWSIAIALLAALTGCDGIGKKGNGHVTTETRQIDPFNKLTIDGIFPVELEQNGDSAFVKVQTDENLQGDIVATNHGDRLEIKLKDGVKISRSTRLKIYVNVKSLSDLDFNSVGSLTTDDTLYLDSLQLTTDAMGGVTLNLNAKYLHANFNSVGTTTLNGKVGVVRINNKSVGALSAFGLKTDTLMIHNESVGTTEVYADKAFYIRSSSVGSLYYKGPGEVVELHSEGIGKVQKKTDD